MNREIKFRGKLEYNGKWIYGDLLQYENGDVAIFRDKLSSFGCECTEMSKRDRVIPDTIGQYTGLTDKNGVKIFEGDIAKGVSHKSDSCISELIPFDVIGVVEYHKEYQTLEVRTRQAFLHIEVAIKGEVIGNIHDNPELMK